MIPNKFLKYLALALLSSALFSIETTSDFRGRVVDQSGNPLENATIRITNESTNISSTSSSNDSGNFVISNLEVGGPYTIVVNSSEGRQTYEDVYLNLGKTLSLSVVLTDFEQLVVMGDSIAISQTAVGPNRVFGLTELDSAISFEKDIKDVIRQDPRLFINEGDDRGFQCNGANPRYNSIMVDGIALNDSFGLNTNGYPTNRQPFSYDSIEQVSVELAPFDVRYGGFSACVINAVTKTGSNEIEGAAYYEFTNDEMVGSMIDGSKVQAVPYEEQKIGFTLGGPIVEDKAFFFISAERYDDVDVSKMGYLGSGMPEERSFLSLSDYNRIVTAATDLYGFNPGGLAGAQDSYDNKFLAKFDIEVDDNNSISMSLNYNDGFNNTPSDNDNNEFEFSKHFYERGHEMYAFNFNLFSDIRDDLSSKFSVGYKDVDNRQIGLGGPFGDFQIKVTNPDNGERGTVYFGGTDDSRQANKLAYTSTTISYSLDQLVGNHLISYGIDYEISDVFNLFLQHSQGGEWDFNSIADLESGAARVYFGNTPSYRELDAAPTASLGTATVYVQDEIQASDDLSVIIGFRYDTYMVPDAPAANSGFLSAYGYSNTVNHDGVDALMLRAGFEWDIDDFSTLYGGYGGYSGGNPNVWFYNMFANDGVTAIQVNEKGIDAFNDAMCSPADGSAVSGAGLPGYNVPCSLTSQIVPGTISSTNSMDPNLEIPIIHKIAFGYSSSFGEEGLVFNLDVMYAETENPYYIRDLMYTFSGDTFNGFPQYDSSGRVNRGQDWMLTNSDKRPRDLTYSTSFSKEWFDQSLSISLGYAKNFSENVAPMSSSVAFTNATNYATFNKQDPEIGISRFNIPERVTATLSWTPITIEGQYRTKVSLFLDHFQSNPYSIMMDGYAGSGYGFENGFLIYVPTGESDPGVAGDITELLALTDSLGCARGSICPRNSIDGSWNTVYDLKIAQEFPGFVAGHMAELYLTIKNLGNLLDSKYGVYRDANPQQNVVDVDVSDTGTFTYSNVGSPNGSSIDSERSLYQIKVGFYYRF